MSTLDEFMDLAQQVTNRIWDNVSLEPSQKFVVDRVSGGGDISINPSTVKALRSALDLSPQTLSDAA